MQPEGPVRFVFLLLLAACAQSVAAPDLGGLYNRAARYHGPERNPVIVIPGILGSRLVDESSDRVVWGAFRGDYADPRKPEGARLVGLPMREDATLADLRDGARPDGALDRLKITVLGLPLSLNAYAELLVSLGAGGYRDEGLGLAGAIDYGDDHFTCFQFAYDWRRDNVENARRLHEFILDKRKYVRGELKRRYGKDRPNLKFDIIAHSMGGLVTRYYLRYGAADLPADGSTPEVTWAGAEYVDRAVLVGTPNAGSALAILDLVHGRDFAPILPKYEAALLGTMPSIYQLLPRGRHACLLEGTARHDPLDSALWEKRRWGLADPDQDDVLKMLLPGAPDATARRRIALDHQRKCLDRARAFAAAMDVPARPPTGTQLVLFAGDAVPTPSVVGATSGAVKTVRWAPGDGTVLRSSALGDERIGGEWRPTIETPIAWHRVTFLFRDHIGITKDPTFTDNVLYMLLEEPRHPR